MFFGEFTHTVDVKGRVIIPSRLREAARAESGVEGYYLARGLDRCLYMYTPHRWEAVVARMRQGAFAKKKMRDFSRLFFSSATFAVPDTQGRILLPENLRSLADLKKDVVFAGVQDHVEIWDAARWRGFESEKEDLFEEMAEEISGELFLDDDFRSEGRLT